MSDRLPSDRQYQTYIKVENYVSNEKWGKKPSNRPINELLDMGIINLDKPPNPTSHEVTAWVKKILGISKAGHAGTLDPGATGCLPVALGRGTRVLRSLLTSGKEYICIMDIHHEVTKEKLLSVLDNFKGKIYQTPPVRSNVKRRLRVREIYYLELLEHQNIRSLFKVGCEAGTYIRKLCNDIGLVLGTGAHMRELRRTRTGPFTENNIFTLQELSDAWYYYKTDGIETEIRKIIQPIEVACQHLPKIFVRDSAVAAICHGASLTIPGVVKLTDRITKGTLVAIFTTKNELVALAESLLTTNEIIKNDHGFCAKPTAVIMKRDTYPRKWSL